MKSQNDYTDFEELNTKQNEEENERVSGDSESESNSESQYNHASEEFFDTKSLGGEERDEEITPHVSEEESEDSFYVYIK